MQRPQQPTRADVAAPTQRQTLAAGAHARTSAGGAVEAAKNASGKATASTASAAAAALAKTAPLTSALALRRALQPLDCNRLTSTATAPTAVVVASKPTATNAFTYVSRFSSSRPSSSSSSSASSMATTIPNPKNLVAITGLKRKQPQVAAPVEDPHKASTTTAQPLLGGAAPQVSSTPSEQDDGPVTQLQRENIAWLDMLVALLERKYHAHQPPVCIDELVAAKMLDAYNSTTPPATPSINKNKKLKTEQATIVAGSTTYSSSKRSRLSLEKAAHELIPVAEDDKDERRALALRRHAQQIHETSVSSTTCCGCKTGCLKMYCACFTTRGYCHDGCNCDNCKNSRVNGEQRLDAITTYLLNDPRAFSFASAPPLSSSSSSSTGSQFTGFFQLLPEKSSTVVLRGCRCKKSKCLKKYCECFQNGLGCSAHCRCVDCSNDSSATAKEQRAKNKANLDKSAQEASFHAIKVAVTKKPRRNGVQKSVRLRL